MSVLQLSRSVVSVPDRDWPPLVVVYGGLYGWEGKWLLPKIPTVLRQSSILVLPRHYTNDCKACLTEYFQSTSMDPDDVSSYALCGYSRGGLEVYRNARGFAVSGDKRVDWKILGLIDPSPPSFGGFQDNVLDGVINKVRCVYWPPRWSSYGKQVENFAKHLQDVKAKIIIDKTAHENMPTFFFQQFQSDF